MFKRCYFILLFDHCFTFDKIFQEYEYLVKWDVYSAFSCTWEPEEHLPTAVIRNFMRPTVRPRGIEEAADELLAACQRTANHFY